MYPTKDEYTFRSSFGPDFFMGTTRKRFNVKNVTSMNSLHKGAKVALHNDESKFVDTEVYTVKGWYRTVANDDGSIIISLINRKGRKMEISAASFSVVGHSGTGLFNNVNYLTLVK